MGITYELAKKLKEAKWPQELREGDRYYYLGYGDFSKLDIFWEGRTLTTIGTVKVPTLSELIETLGKWFFGLSQAEPGLWYCHSGFVNGTRLGTEGKSPEEAVAKLWIDINKRPQ